MVLAAAGATSTMAHSVMVSDMVRFCGHVAGCNCGRLRLQAAANSDSADALCGRVSIYSLSIA